MKQYHAMDIPHLLKCAHLLSRTVKDLITWADPKQAGNGSIHNTVGKVANLLTGSLAVERVSVGTLMSE